MNCTETNRIYGRHSRGRGFTIIELLVVVAIIAVFIGIGVAAFRGGDTAGLQSAQRTLSSTINGARSQASVHQQTVIIAINDDPDDRENYLRQIWVLRRHPNPSANEEPPGGATNWLPVGDPIRLPRGIYIVPTPNDRIDPGPPVQTNQIRTGVRRLNADFFNDFDHSSDETTHNNRKSNTGIEDLYIGYHSSANPDSKKVMTLRFGARGFPSSSSYRLVAAVGQTTQAGPRFQDSNQIVGMFVQRYGTTLQITDPLTFDTN